MSAFCPLFSEYLSASKEQEFPTLILERSSSNPTYPIFSLSNYYISLALYTSLWCISFVEEFHGRVLFSWQILLHFITFQAYITHEDHFVKQTNKTNETQNKTDNKNKAQRS